MTFLLSNLPSANIHPGLIDKELKNEVAASHMLGPFMVSEAIKIFGGFFHCSPVGLVEKVPGDGIWHMVRHLSKQDGNGNSTNNWIDSDDFPTTYFTSTWVAQFVSLLFIIYPILLSYSSHTSFYLWPEADVSVAYSPVILVYSPVFLVYSPGVCS